MYKMEIKLISQDKKAGKLTFLLKGSSPAFANMLRRTIINEVPTMAMEDIEFRQNSSVLYDELVAHRLGLIPLKTDLKSYNLPEDCKCEGEGCSRCQLKLILKEKTGGTVYSEDISSLDPKVVPVEGKIPIVKLGKNQSLEFEATAILGKGKEHAKWSPGLVFYKYAPAIELTKDVKEHNLIVESCPKSVFELKNKKAVVNPKRLNECHLCGACVDVDAGVKLNEKSDEFIFTIESWGQLTPKEMLDEAMNIFKNKLDVFIKAIK